MSLGRGIKPQACRIVHDQNTNTYSLLVHQRGTWVLGKRPKPDFLSNLATFHKANPGFGAELSSFVAILTKNEPCKIVHCNNTSKISWVVHQKGAWVLGGESTADFLPNLDVTWRGQPIICINIEYVCGYFDQKYNYLCRIVHHQSTNKNSSLPLLPAHHPDPCGLLSLVAAWRQASCSITARTSGGAFYCSCHCPCAKVSQHSPYVDACFLLLFWFFCSLHIELLN